MSAPTAPGVAPYGAYNTATVASKSSSASSTPPPPPPTNSTQTVVSPDNAAAKNKREWPASVRGYVQRSFMPQNMDASVSRSDMEAKLKATIQHADMAGTLHTVDWDNMPLPQQMLKEERLREMQSHASWTDVSASGNRKATATSLKRKSTDMTHEETSSATPPWRKGAAPLGDRITFQSPDKRQSLDDAGSKSKFQKQLEKRQRRFDGGYTSTYRSPSPSAEAGPVVGTCEVLEKRYLRLTSAPNPAVVRPQRILAQTLDLLKKKWRKESNYSYICDQFKSMRQDLTVQRIKNDFTVEVYEIHARIALEKGDLGEYNQCQTQLKALYQLGLKGNPLEFKAYRILYFIHTANRSALSDAIKDLTAAEKEEKAIKHALDVRSSLALGNYHRFFQLYLDTPNMGAYLMDMFVGRERLAALANICKAYKPSVRLRFITEELGFESDADAAQFIMDNNAQHLLQEQGDDILFLCGKAGVLFEDARKAAFSKIDIKGQI